MKTSILQSLLFISIIVLILDVNKVLSRPNVGLLDKVNKALEKGKEDKAEKYLLWYGYLGQDYTDKPDKKKLKKKLKAFQYYAGIPVTGEIDAATLVQMDKSRCGMKDPEITFEPGRKRRYNLQGNQWEFPEGSDRTLTWHLKNSARGINYETTRLVVFDALAKWQAVANINFKETPVADKADLLVSFVRGVHGDAYPFDGPGGTLAHAFYPYKGYAIGGDIHFDDDEDFTYRKRYGTDIMWVAVHEAGHSLGLEHSYERDAIMYPWYQGSLGGVFDLRQDDIRGIQALYGARPQTPKPTIPTTTTAATTTTTTRPPTTTTTKPPTTTTTTTKPPTTTLAPTTAKKSTDEKKDCMPKIDAVAQDPYTGWMFVFSGDFFYLVSRKGLKYGPILSKTYFRALESSVTAAYVRKHDFAFVLFTGDVYYIYKNFRLQQGRRPVTDFGLPAGTKVDAALQWQGSKRTRWVPGTRTYLFTGTKYYRYHEVNKNIDTGYPRIISRAWRGLPSRVTGAATGFKQSNGKGDTYFVMDDRFYIFDDERIYVKPGYPRHIKQWLNCKTKDSGSLRFPPIGSLFASDDAGNKKAKKGDFP